MPNDTKQLLRKIKQAKFTERDARSLARMIYGAARSSKSSAPPEWKHEKAVVALLETSEEE